MASLPDSLALSRPNRYRLAWVLLALFGLILGGKLLEDSLIERLRNDCGSLFADRLVPAILLVQMGDQLHLKRHLLEGYLASDSGDIGPVQHQQGQYDARLASLIEEFEQTYLVENEARYLQELRRTLAHYQTEETRLLERHQAGEEVHYGADAKASFQTARASLLQLTEVQETVGLELRDEFTSNALNMTSLLYFQLGIAFVLGLLSTGLAMTLVRPTPRDTPPPDSSLH